MVYNQFFLKQPSPVIHNYHIGTTLLQGMSGKISELEEELAKVNGELEQEKETSLAQTEEIEALKKV